MILGIVCFFHWNSSVALKLLAYLFAFSDTCFACNVILKSVTSVNDLYKCFMIWGHENCIIIKTSYLYWTNCEVFSGVFTLQIIHSIHDCPKLLIANSIKKKMLPKEGDTNRHSKFLTCIVLSRKNFAPLVF